MYAKSLKDTCDKIYMQYKFDQIHMQYKFVTMENICLVSGSNMVVSFCMK